MAALQTSPPPGEPVCLEDAKAHLKVDHIEEDVLIAGLIGAARLQVESMTGLSLVTQGWTVFIDRWPHDGIIELPVAPVQAVGAINVYDADGVPALVDTADYEIDLVSRPARIAMRASGGQVQPGLTVNGIAIDLTAGYGGNADAVPDALRQAVLQLVGHWYDNRAEIRFDDRPHLVPFGVSALLSSYRKVRL